MKANYTTENDKIPDDWDVVYLEDFSTLQRGKDLSKNNFANGSVPVAGSNGIIGFHNAANCKSPGVTVGRSGSCGKVFYYDHDFWAHNTCLFVKNFHGNNPKFAFYKLTSLNLERFASGVSVPTLNKNVFKNIEIAIPKPPEQKKIAHILTLIQNAIARQDEIIRTATELKKALMQKLFTEGLHGEKQKETEIGLIPESWELKRFKDCYRYTSKPRNLDIKKQKDVCFIPMELIPDNLVYAEKYQLKSGYQLSSGTYVENGDLLLAKITPSFENGKQGILKIPHDFGYATTEVISIKNIDSMNYKLFLFYYLLKDNVRKMLACKMEGATGRQRLPKSVLDNIILPFPPLSEQKEIASIFVFIDNKIQFHEKKKQTLTDLFKSMLHQLMTGNIRVNHLDFDIQGHD